MTSTSRILKLGISILVLTLTLVVLPSVAAESVAVTTGAEAGAECNGLIDTECTEEICNQAGCWIALCQLWVGGQCVLG